MLAGSVGVGLAALFAPTAAAPTSVSDPLSVLVDPYAPEPTLYPTTSPVRPAKSISYDEAAYVSARKTDANAALAS